jgi:hypothetical protein
LRQIRENVWISSGITTARGQRRFLLDVLFRRSFSRDFEFYAQHALFIRTKDQKVLTLVGRSERMEEGSRPNGRAPGFRLREFYGTVPPALPEVRVLRKETSRPVIHRSQRPPVAKAPSQRGAALSYDPVAAPAAEAEGNRQIEARANGSEHNHLVFRS